MARALTLSYAVFCYLIFLAVFLAAIWSVRSMDRPQGAGPLGQARNGGWPLLGISIQVRSNPSPHHSRACAARVAIQLPATRQEQ